MFEAKSDAAGRHAVPAPALPSPRRRAVFYLALGLFAFATFDWVCTGLNSATEILLTTPVANDFAFALLMMMPLVALIAGVPIVNRSLRFDAIALLSIVAALGVLVAGATLFFGLVLDRSFNTSNPTVMSTGRYRLVIYQFDYPTSEGGGVVFQECLLVPGLVLARRIYDRPSGEDVAAAIDTPDHVSIDGSSVRLRPLGWPVCR